MKHTGKPPKKSFGSSSGRSGAAGKGGGKRSSFGGSRPERDQKPASGGAKRGKSYGPIGQSGGQSGGRSGKKSAARIREDRVEGRIDTRRDPGYSELRDTRAPRTVSKKPAKGNMGRPDPKSGAGRKPRRDDRPARPPREDRQSPGQNTGQNLESSFRPVRTPRASLGPRPNLFGQHAVRESWLNPKRSIHALYITEDTEKTFAAWPSPKVARPMPVIVTKDDLDRMLGRDAVHQGFAISAAPLEESFVQDIISIGAAKEKSVVLMLDQVTDPHNVGAILRSACAFGADGVVMQKRHAPELEGVLCKTACGAVDHLLVAYETNLSRSLEELAEAGYTVIGLDEHAETSLSAIEPPEKCVLILGAEGDGMRRLIREHCDVLVTLPTQKPINSLNVSNAAAVALYALISG